MDYLMYSIHQIILFCDSEEWFIFKFIFYKDNIDKRFTNLIWNKFWKWFSALDHVTFTSEAFGESKNEQSSGIFGNDVLVIAAPGGR